MISILRHRAYSFQRAVVARSDAWRATAQQFGNARRTWWTMAMTPRRTPIVLLLAPEAGLPSYMATHAIVADSLAHAGVKAVVLTCAGTLPTCPVKISFGIPSTASGDTRNVACHTCLAASADVASQHRLNTVSIEQFVTREHARLIARLLTKSEVAPWRLEHDGIEFGRLAVADVFRNARKTALEEFDDRDFAQLRAIVEMSLKTYLALQVLLGRFSVRRIVHFGDYAHWIAAQVLAGRHGIALSNLSNGYSRDIDQRLLSIRPRFAIQHMLQQAAGWDLHRDTPLPATTIREIGEAALYRLENHGGTTVYSPRWRSEDAGSVLASLGLSEGKSTYVAFPSSNDEFLAVKEHARILGFPYGAGPQPFPDQATWLKALIAWAAGRQDVQLIVRLHPRMGVGPRHPEAATEAQTWRAQLSDLPDNVVVVWPESSLSSYNLAELADAALIAWSNIGLELARFGVPVVAAFSGIGIFPTGGFIDWSPTTEGYFATLDAVRSREATLSRLLEAFRWTHFLHHSPLVDVSDLIPDASYHRVPEPRVARNADTIVDVIARGEDLAALNMSRLPCTPAASEVERGTLLGTIEQFILFFMSGENARPEHHVSVLSDAHPIDRGARPDMPILHVGADGAVTLQLRGFRFQRRTPLVRRLGSLLAGVSASTKPLAEHDVAVDVA